MITMELLGKVRRMQMRDKLSERAIAKRTGLSRNTVHKWLQTPEEVQVPKYVRAKGFNKLGDFIDELEQSLKADALRPKKDRRTARALFTQIKASGYAGGYLDKPLRNHTLMQTIARANRVFPGKHRGTIVDSANVFASLEKALAIYGAGKDGKTPVKDKQQLVDELRRSVVDATAFCDRHGVSLAAMEALATGRLERLQAMEDGMNALIS